MSQRFTPKVTFSYESTRRNKHAPNDCKDAILVYLCRVVGQAAKGISINRYCGELQSLIADSFLIGTLEESLLVSLFFLIHERYQGKINLKQLVYDYIDAVNNHGLIINLVEQLKRFMALNIFLSDVDSLPILKAIGGMNSCEFEGAHKHAVKGTSVEKIFNHLEKNKYGMFKLLQKLDRKQEFIHVLDILDYWSTFYPALEARYKEDLPLFALLISDFKNPADNSLTGNRLEKLKSITDTLTSSMQMPYPNNYDYAFKLIVGSAAYFELDKLISFFHQIHKISKFEPQLIKSYLKNQSLLQSHNAVKLNVNMRFDLQETLIELIFCLNHFLSHGDFLFNPPQLISKSSFKEIASQEENINAKLALFHSRLAFLAQRKSSASEDSYDYHNYHCCFFIALKKTLDLDELKEYSPAYFPAVFTYQGSHKKPIQWFAYLDENGQKQLKKLNDTFEPKNYLNEIKSSALHYANQAEFTQLTDALRNEIEKYAISRKALAAEREVLEQKAKVYQDWQMECTQLRKLNIQKLNEIFFDLWNSQAFMKKLALSPIFYIIIDHIKKVFLTAAFTKIGHSDFAQKLQLELLNLSDFKAADDFNKFERAVKEAEELVAACKKFLKTQSFINYEKDFIRLFDTLTYSSWSSALLLKTIELIIKLNPNDSRDIFKELVRRYNTSLNETEYFILLDKLNQLCDNNLSINTIGKWMPFIWVHAESQELNTILSWVIESEQSNNPLLTFVSNHFDINMDLLTVAKLIELTKTPSLTENQKLVGLFDAMSHNKDKVPANYITTFLNSLTGNQPSSTLALIANCQAIPARKQQTIDYDNLACKLSALSESDFLEIKRFCEKSVLNIQNLSALVGQLNSHKSIEACISAYEKAPFGPRDFKVQFDISKRP